MARVLIAEPTPEIRLLLERAVERLGHVHVAHTRDGADAPPDADVLLLEPALTGGFELARALRERRPDAQIVVCSIYPPSKEVIALGLAAHLEKPFTREALEGALTVAAQRAGVPSRPHLRLCEAG